MTWTVSVKLVIIHGILIHWSFLCFPTSLMKYPMLLSILGIPQVVYKMAAASSSEAFRMSGSGNTATAVLLSPSRGSEGSILGTLAIWKQPFTNFNHSAILIKLCPSFGVGHMLNTAYITFATANVKTITDAFFYTCENLSLFIRKFNTWVNDYECTRVANWPTDSSKL